MLNRYESRHRNYSELCNRSSSRSSMMNHHVVLPSNDSFEDYWEDASVSIGPLHGRDVPSTSLRLGTSELSAVEEDESKGLSVVDSHQIRLHRDACEYIACSERRRSFPPPLASCSTSLSIKGGGRFVLKEMDADRPQSFFRVERGNGRLRLQLVMTDEVDDEEDDNEESCPAEEDATESELFHEETTTSNHDEGIMSDEDGSRCISADKAGPNGDSEENVGLCGTGGAMMHDGCSEGMGCSDARSAYGDTHQDATTCGKDPSFSECDSLLTFGNVELSQFGVEGMTNGKEQESLWNVDVSNQALASLSPWTAKQMCLHASLVSMRPAVGLAMS